MCKVLIIPGINEKHRDNTTAFIKAMAVRMSFGNKDGLGYAAVDASGNLFGERWLDNDDAFVLTEDKKVDESLVETLFKPFLKDKTYAYSSVAKEHNSFGTGSLDKACAITLHTRMATSAKGLVNAHPFVDEDTSLIHNGVIRNVNDFKFSLSSCDSEAILISYLRHNIGKHPEAIQKVASDLTGYYVAAVFGRDSGGNRVLDVFKGNNNNLSVAFVKELGTYVLCSSEYDIKEVCGKLGFSFSSPRDYNDGILMRINPYTGEIIAGHTFKTGEEYVSSVCSTGTANYANYYSLPGGASKVNKKRHHLSKEELAFLTHKPTLEEMSEREAWDYLQFKYGGD
jgi:hypothetical protein